MCDIQIQHIQKYYRKNCVLQDVSLQADYGSCVGILGSNGSGKSTLLSVLAGVSACKKGSFLCEGKDLLRDTKERSRIVGYVPQSIPLLEELTAKDNLSLWYDRKTLKRELESGMLQVLGISDFLNIPVNKMSGGMKKRLSIGCAIADDPKILLLDEPSAALDLVCKEKLYQYFDLFKKQGGLLILATHDMKELSLCDAWYILKDGYLQSYEYRGDLRELVERLS